MQTFKLPSICTRVSPSTDKLLLDTGWRIGQYRLTIYVNTGWRIGQYRLANWPIPVGELANTGWRFRQYRRRYIFEDLGRFEVEIEDSKNMEGLRIMSRYGIEHKKKSIFLFPCPFKGTASWKMTPLFYCRFTKSLLFHSWICMSFAWKVSHFGEISQKHGALWAHRSISAFVSDLPHIQYLPKTLLFHWRICMF